MRIRKLASFRLAIGAAILLLLSIIGSATFVQTADASLVDKVSDIAATLSPPFSGFRNNFKQRSDNAYGSAGDRIIAGKGDQPLSDGTRTDRIQVIEPSGTPSVLSDLRDFEPSLSPDGKQIVYVSVRGTAPTTSQFTLRTYQQLFIMNSDGSDQRMLRSIAPGGKAQPSFSPDGQKIVFVSGDNNIWVRNLATGSESILNTSGCTGSATAESITKKELPQNEAFPGVFGPDTPNYSPDGNYIIFSRTNSGRKLWRVDANGSGSCSLLFQGPDSRAITGRYSPDGTKIAVRTSPADPNEEWYNDLAIIDSTTGAILSQHVPPNFYQSPIWSPDGLSIAYPAADVDFDIFELYVGRAIRTFNLQTQQMQEIYVSGSPEGIHGMTWGMPTSIVPPISLRINSPHPLTSGQSTTGTIKLAAPAPPGGLAVSLAIANGDVTSITLPASLVTVPEGETQVNFAIDSPINTTFRNTDITATSVVGNAQATINLIPARPDLAAVSFTVPSTPVPSASPIPVSWTVTNVGPVTTGTNGGTDLVYFSLDAVWDTNDQQIQSVSNTELLPGNSRNRNSTATIPSNRVPTSGQYYLIFCTNPFGDQPIEANLANNCTPAPIQVQIADLVIQNLVVPASSEPNVAYTLTWDVRNVGQFSAPASTTQVFFSNDNVAGNSDDLFFASVSTAAIAAGGVISQSRSVNILTTPLRPDGTSFFYVKADTSNTVPEGTTTGTGETNNTTFQPTQFVYRVPDMQVTASSVAADVDTDTAFPLTWTTTNAGNKATTANLVDRVYLSTDQTLGSDTTLGSFTLTGGLADGASANRVQNITIPYANVPASGTYYLLIQTDQSNIVNEGVYEGNNIRVQPIYVRRALRPDLVVTNVTAPPTVFFDQTIQVQWTVTNNGTGPTNAPQWKDTVYLSTSPTSTSGASTLVAANSITALNPGESYTASATVKIPRGLSGSYHFIVRANSNNAVNETLTTNNQLSSPVQVNVPPLPDLVVASVQAPDQVFAGTPVSIQYSISNIGTNEAGSRKDRIYLSRDTTLNTGQDKLIFTSDWIYGPEAGQTTNHTSHNRIGLQNPPVYQNVHLPSNLEGDWYVFVVTDYSNSVYEFTAENNNTGSDTAEPGAPMNILVTPPDLVIPNQPTAPATIASGAPFPVEFTVRNQGAFFAGANLYHAVYLSTDATFEASSDTLVGTFFDRDPFAPGAEHPVTLNVATPYCLPNGTYYLFAVADYNGRQFEFDPGFDAEANNVSPARQITLSTVPPDLQITNFTVPPITMPGGTVSVSWTVANTGSATALRWFDRVYLNSLTPGVGSVLIGSFERTGGLAAGGSYTETRSVGLPAYMQGDYFLSVGTDNTNNVPECGSSENNNTAQSANFTVQNNLPDLVIDSVVAPTAATVGDTFNVSWVGRNANQQMPPNSSTFRDTVYLSADTNLSSGDIAIGSALNSVILGAGQTYPQQASAAIGNVAPGTYYILVAADSGRNIYEGPTNSGFESNNVRASAAITLAAPSVDLTVGSVSMSAPQYSGTFRDFSWTVTNAGTSPTLASSWSDYVILSRDSILDPTDTTLGYRTRTGALAGGANYATTASFFVPVGLTGTYTIFVVTDRNNSVVESSNTNNTSSPVTINLTVPPPAELNITNITPPASANVGGVASFSWTVQNTGANPVEGLWRDTFYLSRDQFWDASDTLVGVRDFNSQFTSVPASGGTYTATWSGALPPVEEGTYYVVVRTDAQNRIRESNEANNVTTSVGTTTVTVTQLTINTPFNTTLGNGASLFFKYVTDPAETMVFTLDTDLPFRSNEVLTNFDTMVSRADYDFQSTRPGEGDQENFIPETQEGDYYTMVRTDLIPGSFSSNFDKAPAKSAAQVGGLPDQNITVEAKILPFSIQSVSPETAGNSGFTTILIKGAKFQEGASVKLVGSKGSEILPVMHRVGTAKISALFDLKSKPLGVYDVVVTNPGGATTQLADGFSIVAGGGHQLSEFVQGPRAFRAGVGGQFRYTLSARNDGTNDAINVPFIIDIPQVNYELDRSNILDLPASALPAGTPLPLPIHIDVGDRRIIILLIPILRARTSMNFGVTLSIPSSLNSLSVSTVTLPPLSEIFEAGFTQSDGQQNLAALARSLAQRSPQASTDPNCWAELVRQFAFIVLNQLLKKVDGIKECALFLAGMVAGVSDAVTGAILTNNSGGSTDGVGAAFTFTGVMMNFIQRVSSSLDEGLDCAKEVGKFAIPALEAIALTVSVAQLLYQLYQCLKPIGIDYAILGLTSWDPNEKIGPVGHGAERFVPDQRPMLYRINFENLSSATAPAQKVFISDQIPITLDPRTVRLREIGFKQNQIVLPGDQASYQGRIQLGPDLNNLQADVIAGLDLVNRRIFWTLQAIDPATGEAPTDVLLGLLPPNNANRDGEGYVTFTIEPTAGQATRTEIVNNATIIFDANEPIVTNTTTNLLDSGIPTSVLAPLPPTSSIPVFDLEWSGSDDATGSGLSGYDVMFSDDGGAYQAYLLGSPSTSVTFTGKWGKLYRFYSRARDNAGNIETAPISPDATIQVFGGDTEGDVAPRPNGSDGTLGADDLTQVRRFIARLDSAMQYNEFQRADTSPRDDSGDGVLTVGDIMQLRRFATGLDPIPEAAGPNQEVSFAPKTIAGKSSDLLPREIKPIKIIRTGNQVEVGIVLETQGDETGLGFGLNFDPAVLSNPVVNLRPIASGGSLTVNTDQAAAGKLGILLDKAPNQPLAAGTNVLMTVTFDIAIGAPASTQISFGDDPVKREVVNGLAESLTTTFTPATIQLLGPTAANVSIAGQVTKLDGTPIRGARVTIYGTNPQRLSSNSSSFGYFRIDNVAAGATYTIDVKARGYTFTPRTITVTDSIDDLVLTPEP